MDELDVERLRIGIDQVGNEVVDAHGDPFAFDLISIPGKRKVGCKQAIAGLCQFRRTEGDRNAATCPLAARCRCALIVHRVIGDAAGIGAEHLLKRRVVRTLPVTDQDGYPTEQRIEVLERISVAQRSPVRRVGNPCRVEDVPVAVDVLRGEKSVE